LRRAALFRWMMPFSAALSRAVIAAATASGPSPSARPSAISEARWTSVFASLRVRRFTARRRSDWRTRLRAEGVRAPFQVRAVLATGTSAESLKSRSARHHRSAGGGGSIAPRRRSGHSTDRPWQATIGPDRRRRTSPLAVDRDRATGDNTRGEMSARRPCIAGGRPWHATIEPSDASPELDP
jgi:hypothetical protein